MKPYSCLFFLSLGLFCCTGFLWGAPSAANPPTPGQIRDLPAPTAYAVKTRDANSRVWERTVFEIAPSGQMVPKQHRYVELSTGMHFKKGNQWVESNEHIDILPNGTAAAIQGRHQVTFPGDIYRGVIELVTPDGQHLKSRPMGLSYCDDKNNVLIAELKSSVGMVVGENQVVYPDAFTDFKADLVYTYTKAGFIQDIVLLEQPPLPVTFSMDPVNARLQVLTEFFNTANPDTANGNPNEKNGLSDDTLTFGKMKMVRGKAFSFGNAAEAPSRSGEALVSKSWQLLEGRKFLIEELPVRQIGAQLDKLPVPASSDQPTSPENPVPRKVSTTRQLTPLRLAEACTNNVQLASARPNYKSGFVLDYTIIEDQTNYTFRSDTTYYVPDNFNLSGVTTIEGGTVIKYFTNSDSSINILGTVNCLTTPYRPAVFTPFSDSSVGESVSAGSSSSCTGTMTLHVVNDLNSDVIIYVYDSSWNLVVDCGSVSASSSSDFYFDSGLGEQHYIYGYDTDYYNEFGTYFYPTLQHGTLEVTGDYNSIYSESGGDLCTPPPPGTVVALSLANGGALHDLRICNMDTAISSAGNYSVTDSQFLHCKKALQTESANFFAGNILMSDVGTAFYGQNFHGVIGQLTFDGGTYVTDDSDGAYTSSTVTLTNSLITGVTGYGIVPIYTNHVVKLTSGAGVYQSVSGGNYYLADNSPYRNAGTTSIDSGLLADIGTKTTYPPIAYYNTTFPTAMTFSPRAERDTELPDLGYHYDPLDYAFGGCLANSNVTFTAGTAAGWFRTTSGWSAAGDGLALKNGVTANLNGTVTTPVVWARINTVQEQDLSGGYGPGGMTTWGWTYTANQGASINANFAHCFMMNGDCNHFRDDDCCYDGHMFLIANNCEFYGNVGGYNVTLTFTNCLFFRSSVGLQSDVASSGLTLQNCTIYGHNFCDVLAEHWGGSWPVRISDCTFENADLHVGTTSLYCDYNAYRQGDQRLPISGAHDVIVTNGYNWQSSWLGDFYLPSNSTLINKGSTNANLLALYHFTTQASQTKEANSTVDIGYHYVAVDDYGNPMDTDGDGSPDYLEDTNGDGLYGGGDSGDWLTSPFNGLSCGNRLQVFTPLK